MIRCASDINVWYYYLIRPSVELSSASVPISQWEERAPSPLFMNRAHLCGPGLQQGPGSK